MYGLHRWNGAWHSVGRIGWRLRHTFVLEAQKMISLIWGWVLRHWSVLLMGLLLTWLSVGGTYLFFFRPTTQVKVGHGGTYVEAANGFQPTFGCASGRQFFGWAHQQKGK